MSYENNRENNKSPVAISVNELSKTYKIYKTPQDRLKQILWPGKNEFFTPYDALKNVSFSINRGETIGVVGRNGSGKSTLLQLIVGTLAPSQGNIEVNGKIAALLELGAGFNQEYTGRENVFLNAALLGMSDSEIASKYDLIQRFANIGDFIDQPVKTYSSGMYVRLAFAVAIHSDPDILIVDEALSVGDEAFQRKCFAKIESIQEKGATIIFVSHSAGQILQLCSKAILLDGGEKICEGSPKFVVNNYQRLVNLSQSEALIAREDIKQLNETSLDEQDITIIDEEIDNYQALEFFDPKFISDSRVIYESQGAEIRNIRILNSNGDKVNTLEFGKQYKYVYEAHFQSTSHAVGCGMLVKSVTGVELAGGTTSYNSDLLIPVVYEGETIEAEFQFMCNLTQGTYLINAGLTGEKDGENCFLHRILDALIFKVIDKDKQIATGFFNMLTDLPQAKIKKLPAV